MTMSYHVKQQVVQDIFFRKFLIFLENGKTGFFCFLRVGEAVSMLKVYYQLHIEAAWLTVLNYCKMCRTDRTTPTRQQRFQSSGSQLVVAFFSVWFECSHSLSQLEILFILRSLLHLSYVHSLLPFFLLKMKQKYFNYKKK